MSAERSLIVLTCAPAAAVAVYLGLITAPALGGRPIFGAPPPITLAEAAARDEPAEVQRAIWRGESVSGATRVRADAAGMDRDFIMSPAEAAVMRRSYRSMGLLTAHGLRLTHDEAVRLHCFALWRRDVHLAELIGVRMRTVAPDDVCRRQRPPEWAYAIEGFVADPGRYQAPVPTPEQVRRIEDLRRDLLGVAAGVDAAVGDLAEDLCGMTSTPPASAACAGLAGAVDRAIRGTPLDDASSRTLADLLYSALHVRAIPDNERRALEAALKEPLARFGAPEAAVSAVIDAVRALR
jgi:hypothetical protein